MAPETSTWGDLERPVTTIAIFLKSSTKNLPIEHPLESRRSANNVTANQQAWFEAKQSLTKKKPREARMMGESNWKKEDLARKLA